MFSRNAFDIRDRVSTADYRTEHRAAQSARLLCHEPPLGTTRLRATVTRLGKGSPPQHMPCWVWAASAACDENEELEVRNSPTETTPQPRERCAALAVATRYLVETTLNRWGSTNDNRITTRYDDLGRRPHPWHRHR